MKLRWGLIGGGEGSQIGGIHGIASGLDGAFKFVAGALDIDPDRGRAQVGLHGIATIEAAVESARRGGGWVEVTRA